MGGEALQLEGAEGGSLRGDVQRAAEGEFRRAAAQRFFGRNARHIGIVILLGEMRENEMLRAAVEDLRIGEEFADDGVRKMSRAAHDALLDVPRVGPDFEHLEIVIRFENQEIRVAQMMLHEFGQIAEVRDDGYFRAVRAKGVADGIGRVMRNREGRDFDIADFELHARADVLDAFDGGFFHRLAGFFGEHLQDFAVGRLGEIRGASPFALHLAQTATVVGVLVGDEDGVDAFRAGAAERFEPPHHFLSAVACVNQESGAPGFEQCGIARASRRQNGDPKRDAPSLAGRCAIPSARRRKG